MWNKDEQEGKVDQVKGKIKQAVGDLTDNAELHDEGKVDEASGEVKETLGQVRRKTGEAIEDLGKSVKR